MRPLLSRRTRKKEKCGKNLMRRKERHSGYTRTGIDDQNSNLADLKKLNFVMILTQIM
jgi:hypothetical protein